MRARFYPWSRPLFHRHHRPSFISFHIFFFVSLFFIFHSTVPPLWICMLCRDVPNLLLLVMQAKCIYVLESVPFRRSTYIRVRVNAFPGG